MPSFKDGVQVIKKMTEEEYEAQLMDAENRVMAAWLTKRKRKKIPFCMVVLNPDGTKYARFSSPSRERSVELVQVMNGLVTHILAKK